MMDFRRGIKPPFAPALPLAEQVQLWTDEKLRANIKDEQQRMLRMGHDYSEYLRILEVEVQRRCTSTCPVCGKHKNDHCIEEHGMQDV